MKINPKGAHFDTIEAENPQNTISRMRLKMAEGLGTVYTRGKGLLRAMLSNVLMYSGTIH
jgi:hypothetical protein